MKEAIIIGAGPAGLTAGLELLRAGEWNVTILEESAEMGGISRTVRYGGNRMDIGGHRFFSKDERVTRWWKDILPLQGAPSFDDKRLGRQSPLFPGGPDPETEDAVMLVRRRISRIYYRGKFFDYPISMKWETIKNMGFFTTVKAGFSYLKTLFVKLPENSLENFYINRFGRVLYSMFFEDYTEKLWGRHPREISADWGAQRVKGLSIKAILKDMFSKLLGGGEKRKEVETSLIEEFIYPKFGPGQLWEQVASLVEEQGGKIVRNCRAERFSTSENRITAVHCQTPEGPKTYSGDAVVSTMPVKELVLGLGTAVSEESRAIGAGLPYRDFVTVGMLVPALGLANKTGISTLGNIVPDCWIYVQDAGVKLGRIQIFNNWSPYMVADPEHTVWVGLEYFCNENDSFWNMGNEECIAFAAGELVKMGVLQSAGDVLDAHREKVKKAYPAYFDTYSRMEELTACLDGFENLYCLGRNGQHRYNNMDHSMVTAFEAVQNITAGRTGKGNIWSVNTEKDYHEKK